MFSETETVHYKKGNKSVMNATPFYLGDDNNEEVDFNGETLRSTLRMVKIWTIEWVFKKIKVIVIALVEDIYLQQQKFIAI